MESRIAIELRGRKPSEVTELLLDNCNVSKISGLTDEFTNLTTISFINVGLTTLEGLPHLESLRTIDLSENKLTGGLDILVKLCPRLYHINLCANRIKDIETLEPLKKLEDLSALDLFDCAVTEIENYRKKVFEMIPQLKFLDGFDINDEEAELSDEEIEGEDELDEEVSDDEANDEADDEEEEAEENGLAYLDSSKALHDEDESEDFIDGNSVQKAAGENGKNGSEANERGIKRKADASADADEPNAKVSQ